MLLDLCLMLATYYRLITLAKLHKCHTLNRIHGGLFTSNNCPHLMRSAKDCIRICVAEKNNTTIFAYFTTRSSF